MMNASKPRENWTAWLEHLAAGNPPFGPPFIANILEVVEGYQEVIRELQTEAGVKS